MRFLHGVVPYVSRETITESMVGAKNASRLVTRAGRHCVRVRCGKTGSQCGAGGRVRSRETKAAKLRRRALLRVQVDQLYESIEERVQFGLLAVG